MHPRCLKLGKPMRIRPTPQEFKRFFKFVDFQAATGCWLWTGYTDKKGYGQFWWRGRKHWSHRWARQAFRGRFKSGQQGDHRITCPRNCVCPDHVKPMRMMDHAHKQKKPMELEPAPF